MNKIISFVLLCALLIMCFSGCAISNGANGDETPNKENSPTENEGKDNTPVIIEGELDKSSDLVATLIKYLEHMHAENYLPETSIGTKIDKIKNEEQALHVAFNKSEYYFVCAYYNDGHNYEAKNYCCVTDYAWVKFNDADEIREKYNDFNFIVGFQVNKASSVTDIVNKDAPVPSIEHFQVYGPNFNDGSNTNDAIAFDDSFIYLNSTDDKTVYHSISSYYHILKAIPCISIDGQYYVILLSQRGHNFNAVDLNSNHIHIEFGKYYDALISKLERHREISLIDGLATCYWIIGVDNFASCISNYGEE